MLHLPIAENDNFVISQLQKTKTILNHDISKFIGYENIKISSYSSRALALSGLDDIVQLHPSLKFEWPYIVEHYQRVGLSHTSNIIWDIEFQIFTELEEYQPSFFYYGGYLFDSYADSNFFNIVKFISCKNKFMRVAQDLNLPVPMTFCYDDKNYISDTSIFSYPCYLKDSYVTKADSKWLCNNSLELFTALHNFDDEQAIQIQENLNTIEYLNVQYNIIQNKPERLSSIYYLNDHIKYNKHLQSSEDTCWELTDKFANYLYSKGMQGVFSFNIAMVKNDNETNYNFVDCCPRFNRGSYPALIANKLGADNWSYDEIPCTARSLQKLNLSGIEYNPTLSRGIVLVNWGALKEGILSVLLIGSEPEQKELKIKLLGRL